MGTHALLEDPVRFASLALCVVDEQHRFGVRQRAALDAKAPAGLAPHALHMTATPIPRTLALTAYGDLETTILRHLPAGRRPVQTHVVDGARARARAYERVREEIAAGRQCFVVCPLVSESEALQARAATDEAERLRQTEFRELSVGLIHGQMSSADKQEAMRGFADGETDVLVATSVIEVGIDVPNATVMLIEAAERYGLSQLHQLRGRVGRGGTSRSASCSAIRSCRGWRPSPRTRTASSSPRWTWTCAAPARCWAPARAACRSSAWRGCPTTRSCWSAPAPTPTPPSRPTPAWTSPSTPCCAAP